MLIIDMVIDSDDNEWMMLVSVMAVITVVISGKLLNGVVNRIKTT